MARNQGRKKRRNQRNVPRRPRATRTIARALSLSPRRSRAPVDPPALKAHFRFSGIIPALVTVAAKENTAPVNINYPGLSHINCNVDNDTKPTTVRPTALSYADVWQLAQSAFGFLGNQTAAGYEMCLHKITFWGQPASTIVASQSQGSGSSTSPVVKLQGTTSTLAPEIMLSVDSGVPFARFTIRDVGTLTRRACCCITLPYKTWVASTTTDNPILIVPDPNGDGYVNTDLTVGHHLGMVHISLTLVANDCPTNALTSGSTAVPPTVKTIFAGFDKLL